MRSVQAFVLFCISSTSFCGRLSENERIEQWYERNVWPPSWQEETEGFKRTQAFREREIMQLTGAQERWENWMQFTQGLMVPKFTENGFDLVETPPAIHQKLYKAVMDGVADWDNLIDETPSEGIYGELPCKFVELNELAWSVIEELKEFHEDWAGGMKLIPTSAYGVRLYQNGSSLVMHHDKVHSHVISSIIHIAHAYDSEDEPWPIQIEDHDGRMHSISLREGQVLFYESAKCLHGRMSTFRGRYYGSIFLHYKPADPLLWAFSNEDVINNVPPHWRDGVSDDQIGSRWAGQGLTIDSLAAAGCPPRVEEGLFIHDRKSPYAHRPYEQHNLHLQEEEL